MEKKPAKMETPKTFYAWQQAEEGGNVYKLYIYDDISKYGKFNWHTWEYDESETSANHIRKLLEQLPEGAELEIHINSNGGEAFEAVAIYNLLNQYKGHKTSYVDGVAHSAAFIIPFACDHRIMGIGTACLFHNMWSYVTGNATELRNAADRLDALMESNRKIYLQRAKNLTEKDIISMMEKETILTPEQCLEYGFCDEIKGYAQNPEELEQQTEQYLERIKGLAVKQKEISKQLQVFTQQAAPKEEKNNGNEKALNFMSAFLNATIRK